MRGGHAYRLGLLLLAAAASASAAPRSFTVKNSRRAKAAPFAYGAGVVFQFLPTAPASECSGAAMTGANGEVVTFSRASSAACTKSDGTVVMLASGQPRVSSDGYLSEISATNLVLQNRDLSQSVWTKTNATCTLTATGTGGAANAASTCTATGANATVLQTVTVASASRSTSLYLKRRTGTGTISVTRDGGTTWIDVTSSLSTGAYFRVRPGTHSGMTSSVTNPTVGIRISTSGDAVDVDRVQDESGSFATSPIDTAGTAATRAADLASVPNPLTASNTTWCVAGTVTIPKSPYGTGNTVWFGLGPTYAGSNYGFSRFESSGVPSFYIWDNGGGLHYVIGNGSAVATGAHRIRACSAAGTMTLTVDGVAVSSPSTSGITTGTITTPQSPIYIGAAGTNTPQQISAPLKDVCISTTTGACT